LDSWERWKSLPYKGQRGVVAGIVALIGIGLVAWRFALAIGIFVIVVALYLRSTKHKDAL
jgi:hypothetical protein